MTIGCLMLDVASTSLTEEEKEMLQHPLVGGIILFSRNFHNQAQIQELCASIRRAATRPLLIAVDQEGGRVQRFHEEFTRLPAMGAFQHHDIAEEQILDCITSTGWLMAAELIASGIDISFAPVLDLDIHISRVIGDRGFSSSPETIINYASAFIQGMKKAGMSSTGKHFPGHGSTAADSHFELPVDERSMQQIRELDLSVFVQLCKNGLDAIMPAHVIYSEVDPIPACFSKYWLQSILRQEIGFKGAIFSDDLSMEGATIMGNITERANKALAAGCDMVICCNDKVLSSQLLDTLVQKNDLEKFNHVQGMISKPADYSFNQLQMKPAWLKAKKNLEKLEN